MAANEIPGGTASARMRRFLGAIALTGVVAVAPILACGSRTSLLEDTTLVVALADADVPDPVDATVPDADDGRADVTDAADRTAPDVRETGPLVEGGDLDVKTDCPETTTCVERDPNYVYRCGVRVRQCSSLETCVQGECKNPCTDTLGQDTSNGCEFFPLEMDLTEEVMGVCYAVFLVNQWKTGEPARIEVDRGGVPLPVEQFTRVPSGTGTNITYGPYSSVAGLARDQVAVLFLSRDPAGLQDPSVISPRRLASCPAGVTPAVVGDAALHGTGIGTAFHVKTNVPVVAYQVLPFGAGRARATGATLLLPTNVWELNYVAVNAFAKPVLFDQARSGPTLAIVASFDNTDVRVRPTARIVGGPGVPGTASGFPQSYRLNRGQYLQFTQDEELTGSSIEASAPVAVLGGSTLMNVPLSRMRADSAQQMIPPVRALGHEYLGLRYRSRDRNAEESVPWRFVGVVDGTVLRFDPPDSVGRSTISLRGGEVVEVQGPGPFVVRSQDAAHPFYMAGYMTGGEPYDGEGDPEFVNVVPPEQFLSRYTFFSDPTYPETNLVVARVKDATTGAFPDVRLGCKGTLDGWMPVGSDGLFEFTRVDLSRGDFVSQGACANGVNSLEASFTDPRASSPRVGVTVWGWGNPVTWPPTMPQTEEANPRFTRWVSYAYPGGLNSRRLNSVVFTAR
ncbi:MAG: IgGFc-binding protein [Polyangiaceae bacterium]